MYRPKDVGRPFHWDVRFAKTIKVWGVKSRLLISDQPTIHDRFAETTARAARWHVGRPPLRDWDELKTPKDERTTASLRRPLR